MKQHSGSRLGFTQIPMKIHSGRQIAISFLFPKIHASEENILKSIWSSAHRWNSKIYSLLIWSIGSMTRIQIKIGGVISERGVSCPFIRSSLAILSYSMWKCKTQVFPAAFHVNSGDLNIERQSSSQANSPSLTQMDIPTSSPKTVLRYWISLAKNWT